MGKVIKPFHVLTWDFNTDTMVPYDVMPYLVRKYKEYKPKKDRPKTFEEFKEFVRKESQYQWWARCEYELILTGWPKRKNELKIDVHQQVMMNIDVVTNLLMENVNGRQSKSS